MPADVRSSRSEKAHFHVAQTSSLPYRGFPIRMPAAVAEACKRSGGLPIGNRRYGRLGNLRYTPGGRHAR